jgi:hypothetical protein
MTAPRTPTEKRGRAAGLNTPNRFETLHLEPDDEDYKAKEPTQFFVDSTRSALAENSSPDVGFRYSINPYRGCEHGCIYCTSGDTPILLADGYTRPLVDLREEDRIYGTQRLGHYRRYVKTVVHAHWEVRKPAWRITLQDGTELVAAGDHRFLTLRGWKFVKGTEQGPDRRPHLTTNDCMLGTGSFERSMSIDTPEYRLGYLCGMIRGDGYLDSGHRRGSRYHRFRLALIDDEPLARTAEYLQTFGVRTRAFVFQKARSNRRQLNGIRMSHRRGFETVRQLIAWPSAPTTCWSRGFLAGIFDAEGGYRDGVLRIANTDPAIIEQTALARIQA